MSLESCAECAQSSGASHKEVTPQGQKLLTTERRSSLHRSEEGRSTSVSLGTKTTCTFSILHGSQNIPLVYLHTKRMLETLFSSTLKQLKS